MWPNDIIRMLRSLINDDDLDAGYTYSDIRLKPLITAAALQVIMEEDFSSDFRVDISNDSISPDPINKGQNGRFFQLLVALKAAIMIAENDYRTTAGKAVLFRDGPSQIDLRGAAEAKGIIYKSVKDKYERARIAYRLGDGMLGEAIVSPYNLSDNGLTNNTDTYGDESRRRFN